MADKSTSGESLKIFISFSRLTTPSTNLRRYILIMNLERMHLSSDGVKG